MTCGFRNALCMMEHVKCHHASNMTNVSMPARTCLEYNRSARQYPYSYLFEVDLAGRWRR